jgi:hypothetical protein
LGLKSHRQNDGFFHKKYFLLELLAMHKVHPEWFETSRQKSDRSQNKVDHSVKIV